MTVLRGFHTALMSAAFLGMACAAANAAGLVVLKSRGTNLRPGQTLDSSQALVLKQGQHVTLISPTGVTLKLDGPYQKAPGIDQDRGVPVTNALSLLVTQRQARVGEVGTTRGAAPSNLPDPWVLDASRAGTVCLRDGSEAVLWRPDRAREAVLTVAPVDRSWKTEARWPAGSDRITIPAPAIIRGGATYLVSLNGAQSAMKVEDVPSQFVQRLHARSLACRQGLRSPGHGPATKREMTGFYLAGFAAQAGARDQIACCRPGCGCLRASCLSPPSSSWHFWPVQTNTSSMAKWSRSHRRNLRIPILSLLR